MIKTEAQTELRLALNVGIVLWLEKKPDECIAHFEDMRQQFNTAESLLRAKFHNNLGLAYKLKAEVSGENIYLERTLDEYQLVKKYLNEIQDLPAIAIVEANIANVLLMLGKTRQAHSYLNTAEAILIDFNDEALLGRALETRARVYLAEGDLDEAWAAIERSERLLMNGVEVSPLAETLQTKAVIEEARQRSVKQ